MTIDPDFARRFAAEWIEAWNAHDLERILAHYADDFEMASPVIVQVAGEPSGVLRGKANVAAYWTKALALRRVLSVSVTPATPGTLPAPSRVKCASCNTTPSAGGAFALT